MRPACARGGVYVGEEGAGVHSKFKGTANEL